MERVDESGRWVSDDGAMWRLVEPSPRGLAVRRGLVNDDGSIDHDNGDGTGTRTTYTPDGTVDTVEQLTGLPIPEPEPVDPLTTLLARLADARSLEEVRQAAQEATQP